MAVLTISREFGSSGDIICKDISFITDYPIIDKHIIESVMLQYGMVLFEKVYNEKHTLWDRFNEEHKRIIDFLNQTMLAFAHLGNCIILGRGGFFVLNDFPKALNVLIREPLEIRAENVLANGLASSKDAAVELVKKEDEIRLDFLKTFYGINGKSTDSYDIVIDTYKVPAKEAGTLIAESLLEIESRNFVSYLNIDSTLLKCVQETLEKQKDS